MFMKQKYLLSFYGKSFESKEKVKPLKRKKL